MVLLEFQATECSVDLGEVEAARIKRAAEPVEHLLVRFVLGIVHRLQQFVVAPNAAAVFRRTGVLARQTNRTLFSRSAATVFSTTTSCSQRSPKSYS